MTTKKTLIVSAILSVIIAVVVLVVGLNFVGNSTPVISQRVGQVGADGGTYNSPVSFVAGISLDSNNELVVSKSSVMGPGVNQAFYQNKTGRIVYVDYIDAYPVSTTNNFGAVTTASSSMRVSVGTSTTASIANNFAAPFATLIDNALIATGTPMVVNSDKDVGTNGRGTIPVLPGQYIYILMRQDSGNTCTGSICETATSTNRGFNLKWYLEFHYAQ